jgi:hypothetical protein
MGKEDMKMMIRISQPIYLEQIMGKFNGVKKVHVERKGKREWLLIRFTDNLATLPRGYKPVLNDLEVEMMDF